MESRLRKLVSDLLARSLPLRKIQLWPKKLEVCIADKSALLTVAQRQNCLTYFVGFQVDRYRMRGSELNVELPLHNFREYELSKFQPHISGQDILAKAFRVKELPKICFEGIYPGGKLEAMKKRRALRLADPERQERKRLAKLEELKLKMDEIKRKKEDKKRKREEVELLDETAAMGQSLNDDEVVVTKIEDEGSGMNQETNLLEDALDTMLGNTGEAKTREEAEADRQKLLAGELLVEGIEAESDDEEAGYTGDGARLTYFAKSKTAVQYKDKRSLPITDAEAEILKKMGYAIVSDDECKILGTNLIPQWRASRGTGDVKVRKPIVGKIIFKRKFDMVELDARGYVVDKGDDDFMPSKQWVGRKPGFEFKLGERGLGYYRTGKKVVVPSNTSY